ncbi:hypothetical protein GGR55DRAFT_101403 [Xylaria sp. FL0064]|nr:hypothetical protein GGR55DRAFT_101403 [Xylaria sp. FL0064]
MSASFRGVGVQAETGNTPQPFNSEAFAPNKHQLPLNDELSRKRPRIHDNSLPEPEVISLLLDEEDSCITTPASRRQNHLQPPHYLGNIPNVHSFGEATTPHFGRTAEYTDIAPTLGPGENTIDRDTQRVSMKLKTELDQKPGAFSSQNSFTLPSSSNPEPYPVDQAQDVQDRFRIPIKEPSLCPEQTELVDIICSRRNVFYTGSAGCGKSTVLKAFTRRLRDRGYKVDIVAPTGISALGVGGSTTFVYAGWSLSSLKQPLDKVRLGAHGKHVRKRLKETDVLVIDEISSK